jgi:two-component system, cell cycle response regulator
LRILIAEDDLVTRRLLQSRLSSWGHEVVTCENGAQAWTALSDADAPKLILLDWMMPEMDGLEVCRRIRDRDEQAYTYVIMLTGKSGQEDLVRGLEVGADDYIVKPFDPNELRVRVRAGTRIVQLQEDLLDALAKVRFQASHDSLTGLWNRAAILDILRRELDRSSREHSAVGVIISDLDDFKQINDRFGHLVGDAVIRDAAATIGLSLRSYDSAGRYGGEEFIIVLPGCDKITSAEPAERMRSAIADRCVSSSGSGVRYTMSFGVTALERGEFRLLDSLIREADEALYQAKRAGKNRVAVFQSGRESGTVNE